MNRRNFLRTTVGAVGGAAIPGLATDRAVGENVQIDTGVLYSLTDWFTGNYASVRTTESGQLDLYVAGSRVDSIDDPLWFSWGTDGYGAVSDAGNLKALDTWGDGIETEPATNNGDDLFPILHNQDLFFDRDSSLFTVKNVPQIFNRQGTPQVMASYRSSLPSGTLGGRNAGRKSVYNVRIPGVNLLLQVKTPRRNVYSGVLGHSKPVLAGNFEVYKVNKYSSNTLLLNFHIGYRRERGRHCISVFTTKRRDTPPNVIVERLANRGGEKCFPSVKRLIQNGWKWLQKQIKSAAKTLKNSRYVKHIKRLKRPIAKILISVALIIGSLIASYFTS